LTFGALVTAPLAVGFTIGFAETTGAAPVDLGAVPDAPPGFTLAAVAVALALAVAVALAVALALGTGSTTGGAGSVVALAGTTGSTDGATLALTVGATLGSLATDVPASAGPSPVPPFERSRKKPPATPPAISTAMPMPARIGPSADGPFMGFIAASEAAVVPGEIVAFGEAAPLPGKPGELCDGTGAGTESDAAENDPGVWLSCML